MSDPRWVVVREGKGPLSPGSLRLLERLLDGAAPDRPKLEWVNVEATTTPQARKESARVRADIGLADRVLTMGSLALLAVRGDKKKSAITDERGRMQYLPLDDGGWEALLLPTIDPAAVWADPMWFRDFAYDVIKWATRDAPFEFPQFEYEVPRTIRQLKTALSPFGNRAVVSLDVETTGLDPRRDQLISVGIGSYEIPTVIVPPELLEKEETKDLLWDALWPDPLQRIILHNGKFDLEFLAEWWGAIPDGDGARLGDTQLLSYLLDERPVRSKYKRHGLKDLARVRYDVPNYHFDHDAFQARWRGDEGTEPLTDEDWEEMFEYHAMDCVTTAMLWRDLVPEALEESKRLMEVHDNVLMPASLAIAEAEALGILVDEPFLRRESRRVGRRLERRRCALQRWVGDDAFNPGSPAQLVEIIKDRMGVTDNEWPGKTSGLKAHQRKTKNPTGMPELRQLVERFLKEGRHADARFLSSVLGYRQDAKYLGTYIEGLLNHVGPDGRVHASFNIGGTVTGRLSSSDPNLQSIPKYGTEWGSMVPVRQAFTAEPGWLLMEADYSQLELRTAAAISGDPDLSAVYKEGRDLHLEVSAAIFQKEKEDVSDEERFMAKAINFGVLYGRSGWAISKGDEMSYAVRKLGMERWSVHEADEYVERWKEEFPVLMAWEKMLMEEVKRTRVVETPFGRRRRFHMTRTDARAIGELERAAVNTPVQSAASDICLTSFARVSQAVDRAKARPLSIIHDAVLLEVREDAVDEVAAQIKGIMEEPAVIDTRGIPFTVDVKVGRTLAEGDMRKVKV